MNCPKCGHQMPEASTFCGACGNRLGAGGVAPSPYSATGPGQTQGIHIDEDSRGQGRG